MAFFSIENSFVSFANKVKLLELQWERIVPTSLLICLYTDMKLTLCLHFICILFSKFLLTTGANISGVPLFASNNHNSNITSFFRFVNKRSIYRLGIISFAHAAVQVTDFPVVNVHVDELSSARIWQHKLCATT
jgi:hypothetical protein